MDSGPALASADIGPGPSEVEPPWLGEVLSVLAEKLNSCNPHCEGELLEMGHESVPRSRLSCLGHRAPHRCDRRQAIRVDRGANVAGRCRSSTYALLTRIIDRI